jgi:dCMP deaminase
MTESRRIRAHLKAAKAYAELSHAVRAKVGAVIVRDDRVISIGYNGTPSGRDNVCEVEVEDPDMQIGFPQPSTYSLVTKPEVCHAEMNAIMFAAKNGVSTDGCDLIVTLSPCFECSKMMVQCGIKNVYYDEEYRDLSAVNFLRECGINVEKIDE